MGLRGAGYYITALVVEVAWRRRGSRWDERITTPKRLREKCGLERAAKVAISQARGKREVQEAIACRLGRVRRVGRLDTRSRPLGCMHEVRSVSKRGDRSLLGETKGACLSASQRR